MSVFVGINQWLEKAGQCSCKRDLVIHFCRERNCPNHNAQMVYCYKCLAEGKHSHFPLVMIEDVIREMD